MTPTAAPPDWVVDGGEALFPEARERQRRRRRMIGFIAAVLIAAAATIVAVTRIVDHARVRNAPPQAAGALPTGHVTALRLAGSLAVAPDGALYVADLARHEVLVRLSDGRFRVVAGDGTAGFAGDGGPAVHARLSAISDLAVAPNGALYIADAGRVREITSDGVIRTIAGKRSLGSGAPLSIAISPSGQLYISTGAQVLTLAGGRLDVVPARIPAGPWKGNFNGHPDGLGPIAVDARGNIDVAGLNGWSIWQISHGIAHQVDTGPQSSARQSGGGDSILERAPDGAVYGENGASLVRVGRSRLTVSLAFSQQLAGEYFFLTHFAFAPNGTVYADELPGGIGFEARQQLVAVPRAGRAKLLWEQPPG